MLVDTPTYFVELTQQEYDLIEDHRKQVEDARLRAQKRATCTHEWRYAGHGHNDDCYECYHCGETKWV